MREGPWRSLYPFAAHYHARHGIRQHYVDEGADRARPAVVMVHGNPTWSFFFRGLLSAWAGTRRCIAPDHVGCGLSDIPPDYPYTLQTHIDNLEALLESALPPAGEPGGKIDLLVHDWGGAVGMGYAVRHPERIRRIVAMNTASWPDLKVPRRIYLCRCPGLGAFLVRGLNLFVNLATTQTVERPLPPDVRDGYLAPYDSYAHRVAVLRFVEDIPMSPKDASHAVLSDIAARLETLRDRPMLLPWGMKDWCFSPYYLNGWKERFPAARSLEIADAGHYLLEDAFARVEPAMRAFIDEA